ncbi:MAG: DUF1016 domain-containing protein [Tissierellia bacterium]|nr:DUF1016 domain-containing protein [Tissierellia bacterium]
MKNKFEKWMRDVENKSPNTAYQYARSIDRISEHYCENTGKSLDIYTESNLALLKNLEYEYGLSGRYCDFGNYGNGTIRNAIATYIRFLEYMKVGQELEDSELEYFTEGKIMDNNSEDNIVSNNYNFTYERDLKNSLIYQVEELFPGYKIFGSHQEGIEYNIKGKRIDLLLENLEENILLAIELKAGTADYRVFGQISMYLGLLSKRFPDREIRGLIIAGEIDETLKDACLTNDKIELKIYKMRLILENIR